MHTLVYHIVKFKWSIPIQEYVIAQSILHKSPNFCRIGKKSVLNLTRISVTFLQKKVKFWSNVKEKKCFKISKVKGGKKKRKKSLYKTNLNVHSTIGLKILQNVHLTGKTYNLAILNRNVLYYTKYFLKICLFSDS